MPYPPPSRVPAGPRRRSVLVSAAGAALLTGCSSGAGSGPDSASAVAAARSRAAGDSRGLLDHYDAVLAAHPGLADRLRPLRAQVAAHVKAFSDGTATPAPVSPSPVPAVAKDAVAGLAGAERALADRRAKDLVTAPAEVARTLASVAAAGAAHAYLLAEGAK
ncbi:hypothetical protein NX794_32820 [Streptomyces sp. LP11]|uniref:Lipoprotein n=1 Tax=Streptomyces pyxinicus TaxID=2970331 RepID=A0ABT2BBQ9_9ACTN|nr:hypothetical protein [Streptomyces sp. LP11]MCS0605954.1 hypothetical protein [Streptomyces sp. LP11]